MKLNKFCFHITSFHSIPEAGSLPTIIGMWLVVKWAAGWAVLLLSCVKQWKENNKILGVAYTNYFFHMHIFHTHTKHILWAMVLILGILHTHNIRTRSLWWEFCFTVHGVVLAVKKIKSWYTISRVIMSERDFKPVYRAMKFLLSNL